MLSTPLSPSFQSSQTHIPPPPNRHRTFITPPSMFAAANNTWWHIHSSEANLYLPSCDFGPLLNFVGESRVGGRWGRCAGAAAAAVAVAHTLASCVGCPALSSSAQLLGNCAPNHPTYCRRALRRSRHMLQEGLHASAGPPPVARLLPRRALVRGAAAARQEPAACRHLCFAAQSAAGIPPMRQPASWRRPAWRRGGGCQPPDSQRCCIHGASPARLSGCSQLFFSKCTTFYLYCTCHVLPPHRSCMHQEQK